MTKDELLNQVSVTIDQLIAFHQSNCDNLIGQSNHWEMRIADYKPGKNIPTTNVGLRESFTFDDRDFTIEVDFKLYENGPI